MIVDLFRGAGRGESLGFQGFRRLTGETHPPVSVMLGAGAAHQVHTCIPPRVNPPKLRVHKHVAAWTDQRLFTMKKPTRSFRKWHALHPGYSGTGNRRSAMRKVPKHAFYREILGVRVRVNLMGLFGARSENG